jgi:hypothetical protein
MTTTPTVTKRIGEYDRVTKDYPAFVVFENGQEEYIGSRPTHHDATLLASDYIIQLYQDAHTPEVAAALIRQELQEEGRHEARDMGGAWEGEPDAIDIPSVLELDNLWYCPKCGAELIGVNAPCPNPKCPEPWLVDGGPEAVELIPWETRICSKCSTALPDENTLCPVCAPAEWPKDLYIGPLDPPSCPTCGGEGGCPDCDPSTVDQAVEMAVAMRHVPLPDDLASSEFYAQAQPPAPDQRLLDACEAIDNIASYFQSLFNDVMATVPEYSELCGDWNALTYLLGEAKAEQEKAKAILAAAVPPEVLAAVDRARERVLDEFTRCPSCGDSSFGLCQACQDAGESVEEEWEIEAEKSYQAEEQARLYEEACGAPLGLAWSF